MWPIDPFRRLNGFDALHVTSPAATPGGAYGLELTGVPAARALLVDAPAAWPALELDVRLGSTPGRPADRVGETSALLRLRSGGSVTIERAPARATYSFAARPADGTLVHPHLAGVAAVFAYWLGRETFHAGGFVAGGGVWGLLGDKEAGKSTLLASLARAGVPVMSDDLLVLDGGDALAGPRSVDLRAGAASALGAGEPLGVVGGRERWRMLLDPVAAELPIRGWVTLGWGEHVEVCPVQGSARLRTLAAHRGARLYPPQPELLIELSALPFLELIRPRDWSSAADAVSRLLDAVG
jgi:hypothetical protein